MPSSANAEPPRRPYPTSGSPAVGNSHCSRTVLNTPNPRTPSVSRHAPRLRVQSTYASNLSSDTTAPAKSPPNAPVDPLASVHCSDARQRFSDDAAEPERNRIECHDPTQLRVGHVKVSNEIPVVPLRAECAVASPFGSSAVED